MTPQEAVEFSKSHPFVRGLFSVQQQHGEEWMTVATYNWNSAVRCALGLQGTVRIIPAD